MMAESDGLTLARPAGEPYAGVSETHSAVVFFVGGKGGVALEIAQWLGTQPAAAASWRPLSSSGSYEGGRHAALITYWAGPERR